MKVSKELIRDLKKAEDAVIRIGNGGTDLSLTYREKKNGRGWIKPEREVVYKDENVFVSSFDHDFEPSRATWVLLYSNQCDNLQLLATMLRPDDELYFFARADNNNDYVRNAGLHNDELCAQVRRKEKLIVHRYVIDTQICANNSARNIK